RPPAEAALFVAADYASAFALRAAADKSLIRPAGFGCDRAARRPSVRADTPDRAATEQAAPHHRQTWTDRCSWGRRYGSTAGAIRPNRGRRRNLRPPWD